MFNKALYKQSWKANWVVWLSTTLVSIFVLVIIMLLLGGEGMGKLTSSFSETIIEENLKSNYENSSLNYYILTEETLTDFDYLFIEGFISEVKEKPFVEPDEEVFLNSFMYAFNKINNTMIDRLNEFDEEIIEDDLKYEELKNAILLAFSDELLPSYELEYLISHLEAQDYMELWVSEEIPINMYDHLNDEVRKSYKEARARNSSGLFLALSMTNEDVINEIIDSLSLYDISRETYDSFGFDYEGLIYIANTTIITYNSRLHFELANNPLGLTEEEIKENLKESVTSNFLSKLPEELTSMIDEFDDRDMYTGTLASMYYKIVGMLIAIIYIILVSVNLISGQVDTGSMAYILSTGTKRKQVTNTQTLFLVSSLFFSFLAVTITSMITFRLATPVSTEMTYYKLGIFGLGTFLIGFAFAGINFLSSTIFNRSRTAMAIGGGVAILMLIFTILGMFGMDSMPSLMRLDALNVFNKFSIISLLDENQILANNLNILWKFGILIIIGLITFMISAKVFKDKDLPL